MTAPCWLASAISPVSTMSVVASLLLSLSGEDLLLLLLLLLASLSLCGGVGLQIPNHIGNALGDVRLSQIVLRLPPVAIAHSPDHGVTYRESKGTNMS